MMDEKLLALSKPKLLIVHELGYLPLEPDAAHLFFQLVGRRYETGAMPITSNRSVAEWGGRLRLPPARHRRKQPSTEIIISTVGQFFMTQRGSSGRRLTD
ncbi:DNA replication protein DnaC [Bradyrhizobium sp. S3.12.5]